MEPELLITLVHGTFASDAEWTRSDSKLCSGIGAAIGRKAIFQRFNWSGSNTHRARRSAAQELREQLKLNQTNYPAASQVIIAHSHGGNVALYAVNSTDLKDIKIVTLGTPFFLQNDAIYWR
jgi:alpha-beta hydrolase superfamily lysophospholipase